MNLNIKHFMCLLLFLLLILHTLYVIQIGADVAYMDTLRFVGYYSDVQNKPFDFWRYWNQGSHRGIFAQVVIWLNMYYLGLNALFSNVMTGFVLFFMSLVVCSAYLKSNQDEFFVKNSAVIFFICCVIFGLHAFELYTLDLGFPEISKNLAFIFIAAYYFNLTKASVSNKIIMSLLIVFVLLCMAYGRIYAFVVSFVFAAAASYFWGEKKTIEKEKFRFLLFVIASTMVVFFVLSKLIKPTVNSNAFVLDFSLNIIPGTIYSLASSFVGVEAATEMGLTNVHLLLIGLFIVVLSAVSLVLFILTDAPNKTYLPVFLLGYGVLSAASVAIARGGLGFSGYMASRYYPDVLFTVLGLVWILSFITKNTKVKKIKLLSSISLVLFFFVWGCCYFATTLREVKIVPYRAIAFNEMRKLTLTCDYPVNDKNNILQVYDTSILNSALLVQKENKMGPWRAVNNGCL